MTISISHHEWGSIFGVLGNIVSVMVFLAPVPTFMRIYKNKSTEGFQSLPYLVALFSSMLWLYYALLKTNVTLLVTINSIGCFIELIYTIIYITYATNDARKLTIKLFVAMNVVSFALILLVTNFALRTAHLRVQVLGWICVSISVSVFAAPLSIMAQVIRTKSVQYMPFFLSLFLTMSAVMWFGYGLFRRDICVALPNVVGFLLGVLQMVLYGIYKNSGDDENIKKKVVAEENEGVAGVINIVVVKPGVLGNNCSEVFPLPDDVDIVKKKKKNLDGDHQLKEIEY